MHTNETKLGKKKKKPPSKSHSQTIIQKRPRKECRSICKKERETNMNVGGDGLYNAILILLVAILQNKS